MIDMFTVFENTLTFPLPILGKKMFLLKAETNKKLELGPSTETRVPNCNTRERQFFIKGGVGCLVGSMPDVRLVRGFG